MRCAVPPQLPWATCSTEAKPNIILVHLGGGKAWWLADLLGTYTGANQACTLYY